MSKKILVVDDIEDNYLVVKRLLKKEGHTPTYAESGAKALELLEKQVFDLVLLDWMMPEMDGLEVCQKIKADPKFKLMPVIMLSARAESIDIQKGLDIGADDYATKPVVKHELLARVRTALRRGELESALDKQLKGVAEIQRALLPSKLPQSKDYQVSVYYNPSEDSGGDYYDAFKLNDRYTVFLMADVCGHGAPATVSMALAKSYIKVLAHGETSPSKVLELLSVALYDLLPNSKFITMFYAIFDHEKKTINCSSAGHKQPFLYQKDENALTYLEVEPGFPLKIMVGNPEYAEAPHMIKSGDGILLYTDGYDEAENPQREQLGLERMKEILLKAVDQDNTVGYMMDEWNKFTDGAKQADDIALMYIKF